MKTPRSETSGRVEIDGVSLHYEIRGEGPPLILVSGHGVGTWVWERILSGLADEFTVITFDNRGAGLSDKPEGPYSVGQMAGDMAALMDALGVERAHVLGHSMGGFIAMEFALRYPERVDRLVLASTSAGGATHVPLSPKAMALFVDVSGEPREVVRRRLPLAFTEEYLQTADVEHMIDLRLSTPQPLHAMQAQTQAALAFDRAQTVHEITAPTLVFGASEDLMVPIENARRLAKAIPASRLLVYEDLGHQAFVEVPERFNRDVTAFLKED